MGVRRAVKSVKKNWKFFIVMVVVSAITGVLVMLMTSAFERVTRGPEQLTEQEKTDLKKIYETLTPAEKELARQQYGR